MLKIKLALFGILEQNLFCTYFLNDWVTIPGSHVHMKT